MDIVLDRLCEEMLYKKGVKPKKKLGNKSGVKSELRPGATTMAHALNTPSEVARLVKQARGIKGKQGEK